MRKKKLIARISELESEVARLKDNEDYWKEMVMKFIGELHERGVKVGIEFSRPQIVDAAVLEDKRTLLTPGMATEPPTLRFDFTEHDAKVGVSNG